MNPFVKRWYSKFKGKPKGRKARCYGCENAFKCIMDPKRICKYYATTSTGPK